MKPLCEKMRGGDLLLLLLSCLTGVACGIYIVRMTDLFPDLFGDWYVRLPVFVLLCLLFYFVSIWLHEGGHLVFGLLSGYRFVSFRVFSLMLRKKDGKLSFCRYSIAGTAGQCLLAPPDGERVPVTLYNLGGVLANAICALLSLVGVLLSAEGTFLFESARFFFALHALAALQNGIPLGGMIDNDGKNALSLARDAAARKAWTLLLRVNAAQNEGLRLREMPEEWFAPVAAPETSLGANAAVLFCNRKMDEGKFAEAYDAMQPLLSDAVPLPGVLRSLLRMDALFCTRMVDGLAPVTLTAADDKILRAMPRFPSVLRTRYLLCCEAGDTAAAEKYRRTLSDLHRTYPYAGDLASEEENLALYDAARHHVPPATSLSV